MRGATIGRVCRILGIDIDQGRHKSLNRVVDSDNTTVKVSSDPKTEI